MTDQPQTSARGGTTPPLTDDLVIKLLRDGGRTHHLAERLGTCNRRPEILRRLRKLEAAGRVRRNARLSAVNDIFWEPVETAGTEIATELYDADTDCQHEIVEQWSGVQCWKCGGWMCL